MAATSASNAWAVGSTGSFLSPKPLIVHWNGTSWKQVPSSGLPSGELSGRGRHLRQQRLGGRRH